MITALIVFIVTYLFVGLTQVPRIPINRPAGALVGAVLMVATGMMLVPGMLILIAGVGTAHGAQTRTTGTPSVTVGERAFSVVLLRETPQERVDGLQGFRQLEPGEAALFVFDPPQPATFWMASVTYPIDIVFVDARGIVRRVSAGCRPGSSDVFPSGGPVRWVIETAAGSGIREGETVRVNGIRPDTGGRRWK